MSEAEWSSTHEVGALLQLLFRLGYLERPGNQAANQLRHFACACCRRIWHLLRDPRSRQAVHMAEQWAMGEGSARALAAAHEAANAACWSFEPSTPAYLAAQATCWASIPASREADLVGIALHPGRLADHAWRLVGQAPAGPAGAWQTHLLREVVGNPFHIPTVDPAWVAHEGVRHIARTIRAEGIFTDLPILADALEEAGCADETILAHCRGSSTHVRGCWVIELLCAGTGDMAPAHSERRNPFLAISRHIWRQSSG